MQVLNVGGQNQIVCVTAAADVVQGHGFQEYWSGDPGNTISPQLHTHTHAHTHPTGRRVPGFFPLITSSYILEADLREGKRTGRWQLSNSKQITHRRHCRQDREPEAVQRPPQCSSL